MLNSIDDMVEKDIIELVKIFAQMEVSLKISCLKYCEALRIQFHGHKRPIPMAKNVIYERFFNFFLTAMYPVVRLTQIALFQNNYRLLHLSARCSLIHVLLQSVISPLNAYRPVQALAPQGLAS